MKDYKFLIKKTKALGLIPIGTSTTWILPPSVDPPLIPVSESSGFSNVPKRRIACIPELNRAGYRRLMRIRNRMWATLAEQFPSVELWMVGYEPGFEFYDCGGEQLSLEESILYAVDTLGGVKSAVDVANPRATVVGHFLGRSGMPILMGEQLVQPRQLMRQLLAEIDERGGSRSDYFDELAFSLEPSLLADRFVDERWPGLEFGPQDCTKDFCHETAPWASPGCNIKCCEEFDIPTADLTGEYSEWNKWITPLVQPAVQVTGGEALIRQVTCSDPPECSIGGGISVAGLDIVPDQEFDSEGTAPGDEKNRWTAIQDFTRAEIPQPTSSSHTGVFVRVHDRTGWRPASQTHFGCIVYSNGSAALQFEGDDITVPDETESKQQLVWFSLTENPFDSSNLYRVQTLEREWYHPLEFVWEPWWRAEVYDLTDGGPSIGSQDWIGEWTVENIYGISVPPLKVGSDDSKVGFGLGGGDQYGIDVERTGTSYWVY